MNECGKTFDIFQAENDMTKIMAVLCLCCLLSCSQSPQIDRAALADEIENTLANNVLQTWYPRIINERHGGFFTNFDSRWQPLQNQDKMIVTQARDVWTAAKAALLYPDDASYLRAADHGFAALKTMMWDSTYGGFYQSRGEAGGKASDGYGDEKRTYGNAFGLYAVSAYYELTRDPQALKLAQQIFHWIEDHAYDPQYGGYWQFLRRDGSVIHKRQKSVGWDSTELGLKDQNTSIHTLEAYTELYKVWPDAQVRQRLQSLLFIIRDKITSETGYMRLFFYPDWTPVSHRDSSETYIRKHVRLDHVSFGHDIETAYLMLEASHTLGLNHDERTLAVAQKMVDHVLAQGWDKKYGGIFDVGYYFKGDDHVTILTREKSWWSQMEAMNALLMMSLLYPDNGLYFQRFTEQWRFIDAYLIDHEHGDVYADPIDYSENAKTARKAQAWKGPYHTSRALMHCVRMLRQNELPF